MRFVRFICQLRLVQFACQSSLVQFGYHNGIMEPHHLLLATLVCFFSFGQVGIVPKGTHVQVVPDSTAPWWTWQNDPSLGAKEIVESISNLEKFIMS